jgi:branched-subunit amino acid ABC-type transport system permease component
VTLARYAALVIGMVAAALCLVWPVLSADRRPAVLTGALLAAVNTVCAYFLAHWAEGRSTSAFFTAVLGGMVARMFVLLGAVLVGVLLAGLPKVPFTVSLLSFFVAFLVLELAVLSRRPAGAGAGEGAR